ncbi:GntR family transcriptional regulator / MocR family aminotransferase [Lacicoccus qingdaonensis]|uniref:GntR family transcriptional regulator / MocR family aminotransferase n=1 Tax=Lacicoccus qingdaonensis TaxID=576118 RepID=A0A1G9F926_9BACL|nr:GntR family transcriptional regulator / MocR family aminotransferase [Salinicoccus qingdaonensis]
MDIYLLNIDKKGDAGYLYQKIYKQLKEDILDRKFKTHEKLPAKRTLAEQLDISINTVTNAYEQLLAEGYIYTIERSGYYVEEITQFKSPKTKPYQFPENLKEQPMGREGWLSLSHMTADVENFPFKEWLKAEREAITNHADELAVIGHPQGPYLVRESIAKLVSLNRGVHCEPEQIVISAGAQPLIHSLMQMQAKNTTVAMESPGYSRIHSLLVNTLELEVKLMTVDDMGIDIRQVEQSNADFLFVTPSHHFPTGRIMPISRRIELLNWASKKESRFIIEDDYDSEFKYKTNNIPSLQSLDQHQSTIYMGTFSKSLLPTLRISYMVLPPKILEIYREKFSHVINYNNTLSLFTLHYFIHSGAYERHIKRMNQNYEMKRTLLIDHLKKEFAGKVNIKDIPAGLHFMARFKTDKSYDYIEEKSKEYKLEIYTLKRFSLENESEPKRHADLILGFANINSEDIGEAVERLYKIIGQNDT